MRRDPRKPPGRLFPSDLGCYAWTRRRVNDILGFPADHRSHCWRSDRNRSIAVEGSLAAARSRQRSSCLSLFIKETQKPNDGRKNMRTGTKIAAYMFTLGTLLATAVLTRTAHAQEIAPMKQQLSKQQKIALALSAGPSNIARTRRSRSRTDTAV